MTMPNCSMEGTGFSELGGGLFNFTLDDLGVVEDEEKWNSWQTELCVPQDPIEDLEWFPNFKDDWINLNSLCTITKDETMSRGPFLKSEDEVTDERNSFSTVTDDHTMSDGLLLKNEDEVNNERKFPVAVLHAKKPRTKRVHSRKPSWSSPFSTSTGKKLPKRKVVQEDNAGRRICSHCGADSTPQWRQGPMGPKTLCNACGVRYKSGRLVPEYRPLTSPSFDSQIHSNSHKKIMRMKNTLEVSNI
ncbi:hypothetical protein AQUCO_01400291v1 [Aquilegia coerulea]|uniref:GATA-type domain-containing protein n=1 Tax=Aquilegia coerulea TaxID=218851 RepID=A0A2G5DVJ0_AQUCA|nr:hypothetical protein AQUCO_01400291v1 [Aquilegia coerulea]